MIKIHEGATLPVLAGDIDPDKDYEIKVRVVNLGNCILLHPVGEFDSDGHLMIHLRPADNPAD